MWQGQKRTGPTNDESIPILAYPGNREAGNIGLTTWETRRRDVEGKEKEKGKGRGSLHDLFLLAVHLHQGDGIMQ